MKTEKKLGIVRSRMALSERSCQGWLVTMLLISALMLLDVTVARGAGPEFDFNIPASTADKALVLFAKQADIQVLFPYKAVSSVWLKGLSGKYTASDGVKKLISDSCLYVKSNTKVTELITRFKDSKKNKRILIVSNNKCKSRTLSSLLYSVLATSIGIPDAMAQNLTSIRANALDEIIVTAQRREQSMQKIPVSVTALDASMLEQLGVSDVVDIGYSAPNLQIVETPSNSTAATIAIRGSVTTNPAITWESPVSLYLDGVFIGKNTGSVFDIVELQRVEVLRGPQGTLYGKNTIGGAINLITRKPSEEFGGKLKINLGSKNLISGLASVDTGAVEFAGGKIMSNVSYLSKRRDGFIKNIPDRFDNPLAKPPSSKDFKRIDSDAGRVSLLWQRETVDVAYTFDYSDQNGKPPAGQLTDVAENMGVDLMLPYLVRDNKRSGAISNDSSLYEKSRVTGHALHVDWDMGNWGVFGDVRLRSITSYRKLDWKDTTDLDGTPLEFYISRRNIKYDQNSQEFQLLGNSERLNYVTGLYFLREKSDNLSRGAFMPVFGYPRSHSEYGMKRGESIALFGQADWQPDWTWAEDRLTLSAGIRWTKESKRQYLFRPGVIPYTEQNKNWHNISPTVSMSWQLSNDISVYGKITKGWKAGGFNGESSSIDVFRMAYGPEKVTSYELGLKSRFLDDRFQINVAAFENRLTDMQFTIFSPVAGAVGGAAAATTVGNAGKATVRGFEFELLSRPIEPVTLNINYGYLDTKFNEFMELDPVSMEMRDFKNFRDFPYAAKSTSTIGIQYNIGNFDFGGLSLRLDWNYQSGFNPYVDPVQNSVSKIKSYNLLNARVALSDIQINGDQSLQIAVWGKNITNKNYRIGAIPFGYWAVSYFGDPESYGLEMTYQF